MCYTIIIVMIPGSRFRTKITQHHSKDLQGPPTDLRFVQTIDGNFWNLSAELLSICIIQLLGAQSFAHGKLIARGSPARRPD